MLHFIFTFKDTAPGGKYIEYIQPNITYSSFENFLILSYFFLLIHPKMFYFISGTNHMQEHVMIYGKKDIKKNSSCEMCILIHFCCLK